MEKESEDKAGRILSIYARLKQGKVVYKKEESDRYGVAPDDSERYFRYSVLFAGKCNFHRGDTGNCV